MRARTEAEAVVVLDDRLLNEVAREAAASPRRRMNFNFHSSAQERLHRFLNVIEPGSYIAPHRHLQNPKPESLVVLSGKIGFLTFTEDGGIAQSYLLGGSPGDVRGIDILPGVWHTLFAVDATAICFEVKPGPYDLQTDKEFAAWAPQEGDPQADKYLKKLMVDFARLYS